jgi:hypothetical protein
MCEYARRIFPENEHPPDALPGGVRSSRTEGLHTDEQDATQPNELILHTVPGTRRQEFLGLRQVVVVVQVFAWHIVFRNLVSEYF